MNIPQLDSTQRRLFSLAVALREVSTRDLGRALGYDSLYTHKSLQKLTRYGLLTVEHGIVRPAPEVLEVEMGEGS